MFQNKQTDIVGSRVGIYDVLYECETKDSDGHRLFHVKCSKCGWETDMRMHMIKDASRCKHKLRDGSYVSERKWSSARLRQIYAGILSRCYNQKDKAYRWYGAKGIVMCDEWLFDSSTFEMWALSHGYVDSLTIDRIDESLGYCPDNCRWVTVEANSKYKSTTRIICVDGVSHTGRDWAKILSLGTNVINKMIREYDEDIVIRFIRARMSNPSLKAGNKSWLKVYGLI